MRLAALLLGLVALSSSANEFCRAIDGDTIRCGAERVRLLKIYAPELGEPGGFAARERLGRRLAQGVVTIDRRGRDRYGRTLGNVYVNGVRITQGDIGRVGGRGANRVK